MDEAVKLASELAKTKLIATVAVGVSAITVAATAVVVTRAQRKVNDLDRSVNSLIDACRNNLESIEILTERIKTH